jgi:hypothetical protein
MLLIAGKSECQINWQDKRFDKEGGTMKNPPLIQLGALLTYIGATVLSCGAQWRLMRCGARRGSETAQCSGSDPP